MLTENLRLLIAQMWQPQDSLDNEMVLNATFVFNQILQTVRKEGVTKAAVEHCGMMLFRLYKVWQAYNAKKHTDAGKWLAQILEIAEEARKL